MFEHVGVGISGTLIHDTGVVDSMIHFARVAAVAEAGKSAAIADLAALRVDSQGDRQKRTRLTGQPGKRFRLQDQLLDGCL